MNLERVIVIVGPTGIGKTKLSIELAKYLQTEIINGDAFQVYQELNIGTAKIEEKEKEGIVHHLFDIKKVNENFSVWEYQKLARQKIKEINALGKIPLLVGGTGLYLKAALFDYQFEEEDKVDLSEFNNYSNEELHDYLTKIDPQSALKIHKNNRKRVLRAIEIYLASGQKKSSLIENQEHKEIYETLFIGLETDRKTLYKRCDERVDLMFEKGLLEEVEELYKKYHSFKNLTSFQAIGYKELFDYLEGKISLEEAKELIKKRTRNYVKRQYTWFKKQINAIWINVDFEDFSKTIEEAKKIVAEWRESNG